MTFINLEDETGMVNVVVLSGPVVAVSRPGALGTCAAGAGKLQNAEGAVTVVAERLQRMNLRVGQPVPGTGTEVGTVPRSGAEQVRHDNDDREVMSKTVVVTVKPNSSKTRWLRPTRTGDHDLRA